MWENHLSLALKAAILKMAIPMMHSAWCTEDLITGISTKISVLTTMRTRLQSLTSAILKNQRWYQRRATKEVDTPIRWVVFTKIINTNRHNHMLYLHKLSYFSIHDSGMFFIQHQSVFVILVWIVTVQIY